MKVVCKTNISYQGIIYDLTVGKVYEVYKFNNGVGTAGKGWLYVIDDSGAKEHYRESMHTTLVELRNEKIEELLK
jgi:hypothetical protein